MILIFRGLCRKRSGSYFAVLGLALCAGAALIGGAGSAGEDLPPFFLEAARETGLDFFHFTGATGEYYLPEIMGAGVALFDYDNDGDLDIYVVQGALLAPEKGMEAALFPLESPDPPRNRLFKNLLVETGELRFVDVTAEAGVGHAGYGMGVAVADYDNDGFLDLYVTNFGSNVLYRNNGDGTFTDVTAAAGVDDPRWSASAAFFDYDNDGRLDLFVTSYLDFTVRGNKPCFDAVGMRDYCSPSVYRPLPDRLFRNEGDGRFRDVSEETGIAFASGAGLGAICADFNGNGFVDVYVANDGTPNHLWLNRGDGAFEEVGLLSGTAFNEEGQAEAGMGVCAADFDFDGDEDLFVTNLRQETNTLYVNLGEGRFYDATREFDLALPSLPYTGFGTRWFDYDNDGFLDLFVANGAVEILEALRGEPYPYHQLNQLFRRVKTGRYREVTGEAGAALALSEVSRGAAYGDLDNDGNIDIVVSNNNGPVRLLRNRGHPGHHWLQVRVRQEGVNRDAIGARVGLLKADGRQLWRRVHTDGSYLSAHDLRVHFGLGPDPSLAGILVRWPDGGMEVWEDVEADRSLTLNRGSGRPWKGREGEN